MSRVSCAMLHPGGAAEMTRVLRERLERRDAAACCRGDDRSGRHPGAGVRRQPRHASFAAHHLLPGIDPVELGSVPFPLATDSALELRANLTSAPSTTARVYLLPCVAGHVGTDCAAVILFEGPHLPDEISLIVDVGTNAEIVLGNRHRLLFADRARLCRGADLLRSARRTRSDRAGAHRPRDAGAALLHHRLRSLVGRAELCRDSARHGRHRHLRLGHRRGGGGDVSRWHYRCRRHHPGRAGGAYRLQPSRAAHLRLRAAPGRARSASARRMCAPSSWPRPHSTAVFGC